MAGRLLLDLGHGPGHLPPLLLGQSVELLATDRLALVERDRDHPGHRRLQGDVPLGGETLQLLLEPLALAGDLADDLTAALVVLLALEHPRDLPAHRLEERVHVTRERRAAAGRQRDRVRAVRVGEVVDVHPVVGSGLRRRAGAENVEHGRQAP